MFDKVNIRYKAAFSSMIIVGLFVFIFMIIKNVAPFGIYSFANTDCFHQMMPFLAVFQTKLKTGESLFYNWNSGGGGDFLSTYFYYLASPINFLVVFFEKESLNSFISLSIAIRIIISAGSFCLFINEYSRYMTKDSINDNCSFVFSVAISCGYALSNYICAYMYEIMWLDSLMVFPLILLGYYRLTRDNKPCLYIVSLAYSLYCNYYISYMICLFLVLWFLQDQYDSFRLFLNKGIKFALSSILSAGIAALPLIVSFTGLKKTVSGDEDIIKHEWYGNIFNIIRQQFIFSDTIITSYDDYDANLYCGFFVIILCAVYFAVKRIQVIDKVKRALLIALLFISMNESFLNFVWHGMHKQHGVPNRFAFLLISILLITAMDTFNNSDRDRKANIVGLSVSWLLPIISYFFVDFNSGFSSHFVLLVSYILVFVYTVIICLMFLLNDKWLKTVKLIFSCICIVELLVNAFFTLGSNLLKTDDVRSFLEGVDVVYSYYDAQDDTLFYRSDRSDGMTDNENAYYGMNGLAVFNSTVNREMPDFLLSMGQHTWKNRIKYSQTTEFINDLMGIKYIYTISGINSYEDSPNYIKLYDEGILAYYNQNFLPLAFSVDSKINDYKQISEDRVSDNINAFAMSMNDCGEILSEIIPEYSLNYSGCTLKESPENEIGFEYTDNEGEAKYIDVNISIPEDGEYYIDIREENEDYISFEVNESVVSEGIWLTNGLTRLGNLYSGDNVRVYITDNIGTAFQKNDRTSEVKIYVYKINHDNLQTFVNNNMNNGIELQKFSTTDIQGEIKAETGKMLFTSIPYDDNWHVYVDDKEVKKQIIADAFIGIPLEEGEHNVEFRFIPKVFYLGLVISVLFFAFCIFLLFIHNKKKKD